MSGELAHAFARAMKRGRFLDAHDRALQFKRAGRARSLAEVPEWEELREEARRIKAGVRLDLDRILERFVLEAERRGSRVFHARTAEEANARVLQILLEREARKVVKSKSMTTEECGLNPFLEAEGLRITDTDLGEYIVQLFGEPPSHIVAPAIHRGRREIGKLFAGHGMCGEGEEDPERLTRAARRSLRALFLEAEAGITGANFLVAETGTAVVVENEANSLLGTSLPSLHIIVAGIEKLVPRHRDLAVFLALLARSATGQRMTTYTTHYSGPQERSAEEASLPQRELFIILLDNGRRGLRGGPAEEALACIRCGACLSACPVFRRVGGHAYGQVIPGPIGQILGPAMGGSPDLPKASPLCRLCNEVCPVRIDLAGHLLEWRGELVAEGRLRTGLPPGLSFLLRRPRLYDLLLSLVRRTGPLGGFFLRRLPSLASWSAGGERGFPEMPRESFRRWFRSRKPPEGGKRPDLSGSPPPGDPPASREGVRREEDPEAGFRLALAEAGGELKELAEIPGEAPATSEARGLLEAGGRFLPPAPWSKEELNGLPFLVATARWRIARTGSLWVDFSDLESRAQVLLPENLVLLVPRGRILWDLPDHYAELGEVPACGTLLTGPSKTADIELTLVMGAHGPRRLWVVPC